jgi:hypothetical protein
MTALLDVNILIALADTDHLNHELVTDWFFSVKSRSWATCPITENGMIRILSSKSYGYTQKIESVRKLLIRMRSMAGHQFWEDSISLCEVNRIKTLQDSKSTTDLYLLALAVKNKGQLATLDSRIKSSNVNGADKAYLLIE